jgi:hypothetical protein
MKTAIATLVLTALSTGCTHYANVSRVDAPDKQSEVYESARTDRNGMVRATVQERISSATDGCQDVRVRREYYDADGALQRRIVERQHCGYTVLHLDDSFDGPAHTRRMLVDRDRDGHFEREIVREDSKTANLLTRNHTAPTRN